MDLVSRVKSIDKTQVFLLIVLFLFAFGLRAHLTRYDLLFGFDSYYHARINAEVIETGIAPVVDTMSWYGSPLGGAPLPGTGAFLWGFNAIMYKILTLGAPYDKDTWINVVKILPPLYGALISIAMFFFAKEIFGKKAGYAAGYATAFFSAVVPAFVYRTMAGFLEDDALGFLWMILGLIFFMKAVKNAEFTKKKIAYAAASGIFFGIMAFTWAMFVLVPLVLAGYMVFSIINIYAEKGIKKVIPQIGLFVISMATFAPMTLLVDDGRWIEQAWQYIYNSIPESMSLLVFGGAIVFLLVIAYLIFLGNKSKTEDKSTNKTIKLVAMLLLFATIILLATVFLTSPNLWETSGVIGKSVGEENPGRNYFGEKYNALIILPVLALILIPLRVYRNKNDHLSIIIFFWIFITFFMAWYKLKFTYTFGLPIAAAAGVIIAELLYFLKQRSGLEKKAILLALGFMFLVGIAAGTLFVEDKVPSIEMGSPDWKQALEWLRTETPEDAKMFNWWDYGHWISFVGERAVLTDNRNLYLEPLQDVAKFIITPDLGEALDIVQSYDSDYVILSYDSLQKEVSYAFYAYNTLNSNDVRIKPYWAGPNVIFVCNKALENGEIKLVCGGNVLGAQQTAQLQQGWNTEPNQLYDNRVPLFVYVDEDGYAMYALNPAVNSSMIAKLWFNNPDAMNFFEEVYGEKGIKIFRVKKDAIAARE